jgi:uncharacterized SAM-dependent methyltransferase
LRTEFPGLAIDPTESEYLVPLALPRRPADARSLVFLPGATIGSLEPAIACVLLARLAALVGPHSWLLLAVDANRDLATLLPAYDDAAGVTARFDLNLLAYLNRAYDATFALDQFEHRVVWNNVESRIELQLVSLRDQSVHVSDEPFRFELGESIVTEHSYKLTPPRMAALLAASGWRVRATFPDPSARIHLWLADLGK